MNVKTDVLKYQLSRDLLHAVAEIIFLLAFCGLVFFLQEDMGMSIVTLDNMLAIWCMNLFFEDENNLSKYERYSVFCFSRRQYFNERLICMAGISAIYTIGRCVLRAGWYQIYLTYMLEDNMLTSDPEPVPLLMLFLTNFIFFLSLRLIGFIRWGRKNPDMESGGGKKRGRKPLITVLFWVAGIILMVMVLMGEVYAYAWQLTGGAGVQWLVLGVNVLIFLALYFAARYRYQPKRNL